LYNRRSFLKITGMGIAAFPALGLAFYTRKLISQSYAGTDSKPPPGQYLTSWVGNTFAGKGENGVGRWVQDEIVSLMVTPDGTVLTASTWDEAGRCTGLYKDGDTNVHCLMAEGEARSHSWGWGTAGTAVMVVENAIFISTTSGNLLQFIWSKLGDIQSVIRYKNYVKTGLAVAMTGNATALAILLNNGKVQIRQPHDMQLVSTFRVLGATKFLDEPKGKSPFRLIAGVGIAMDSKNTLWILHAGQIQHFSMAGKQLPGTITGIDKATAISIDKNDVMLVCDNGPSQQILSYALSPTPKLVGRFGILGGLRAATPGVMKPTKFFALRGAGRDAAGNLYVGMCFGPNPNSPVVIRSLNPQQQLRWEVSKYAWVTAFCFDPDSDGKIIYGPESIFSYDPDKAPGTGWQTQAITLDAVRYPDDPRIMGTNACSTELRHLQGKRLLYTMGQTGGGYELYAFEASPSQIAQHVGRIEGGGFACFVDAQGGVWQGQTPDQTIQYYAFDQWSKNGAPLFHKPQHYSIPELFTHITRVHYVDAQDALYIGGYTAEKSKKSWGLVGAVIARYDGWKKGHRHFRWMAEMPLDGHDLPPKSFDIAGDYLFTIAVFPTQGKDSVVTIFRLADGVRIGTISPGESVGSQSGWTDMIHAIHALQRENGQYLIMVEDDARGKNIIYQWSPPPHT